MRVNLDQAARMAGHVMPGSVKSMINDIVRDFCKEYQIGDVEAYGYLLTRDNIHRMVDLMRSRNINAEHYDMVGLSSWGLIITDDDPTLVEYKLKQDQ